MKSFTCPICDHTFEGDESTKVCPMCGSLLETPDEDEAKELVKKIKTVEDKEGPKIEKIKSTPTPVTPKRAAPTPTPVRSTPTYVRPEPTPRREPPRPTPIYVRRKNPRGFHIVNFITALVAFGFMVALFEFINGIGIIRVFFENLTEGYYGEELFIIMIPLIVLAPFFIIELVNMIKKFIYIFTNPDPIPGAYLSSSAARRWSARFRNNSFLSMILASALVITSYSIFFGAEFTALGPKLVMIEIFGIAYIVMTIVKNIVFKKVS